MKIVVTASGTHLDAPASPIFGRCPVYLFVETETLTSQAVDNPAIAASSGAGIQAAQFVVERGAQAVLTGSIIGPNAANALQAAGVPVYQIFEGTVRQAVEMFQQGRLTPIGEANVPFHSGIRGGGRGMGMGRGRGRGGWGGYGQGIPSAPPPASPPPESPASHQEEIAVLRQTADELRRQLNEVTERLGELEED